MVHFRVTKTASSFCQYKLSYKARCPTDKDTTIVTSCLPGNRHCKLENIVSANNSVFSSLYLKAAGKLENIVSRTKGIFEQQNCKQFLLVFRVAIRNVSAVVIVLSSSMSVSL